MNHFITLSSIIISVIKSLFGIVLSCYSGSAQPQHSQLFALPWRGHTRTRSGRFGPVQGRPAAGPVHRQPRLIRRSLAAALARPGRPQPQGQVSQPAGRVRLRPAGWCRLLGRLWGLRDGVGQLAPTSCRPLLAHQGPGEGHQGHDARAGGDGIAPLEHLTCTWDRLPAPIRLQASQRKRVEPAAARGWYIVNVQPKEWTTLKEAWVG